MATTFEIPATGAKVRHAKVISHPGGRVGLLIALQAINQLRAPPIPPEVLTKLHRDYFVAEESFTVLEHR
ncbi:MAG TPA: hypothetical protein VGI60_00575 [Chthoniobacterales bacterium]